MACRCQGCGEDYRVDVRVHDDVWSIISPRPKLEGAGLLCGPCILKRIEAQGMYGCFTLTRTP